MGPEPWGVSNAVVAGYCGSRIDCDDAVGAMGRLARRPIGYVPSMGRLARRPKNRAVAMQLLRNRQFIEIASYSEAAISRLATLPHIACDLYNYQTITVSVHGPL